MLNLNTLPSVGRMAVMATSFMCMANAHMFISEPKPLQGYSPKDPLDPSGSNFPCHGAPLPTSGGQKLVAGETFPLKFEMGADAQGNNAANTAVHGGGSCQLAVLYDTSKAADPSNWNVIYSIEGGCPSNTEGNLSPGYKACTSADEGDCLHSWDIPMPKGVKSGNAILSWTWFNTIGNREMYQNCVNVNIEGGSGDGTFPPLFVANLASVNSLTTTENSDVLFPEPGEFVTTMSATNGHNFPKATVGAAQGGDQGAPSSYAAPAPTSAPAYSAPAGSSAPVVSSVPASSAPAYGAPAYGAPAYSAPPNVQSGIQSYDGQKGRQTQTTFATAVKTSVAAPSSAAPAPTGYSSGPSNPESNNTSSGSGDACSEAGSFRCDSISSFSVCDQGKWVSMGSVSAGMVCRDGIVSGASRFRRHLHAHKH